MCVHKYERDFIINCCVSAQMVICVSLVYKCNNVFLFFNSFEILSISLKCFSPEGSESNDMHFCPRNAHCVEETEELIECECVVSSFLLQFSVSMSDK